MEGGITLEIAILLAERNEHLRQVLHALLKNHEGMKIVAQSDNRRETEVLFKEFAPNIAIVDVHLLDPSPAEAFRRMISRSPKTKIIAFSNYSDRRFMDEMLKAGASGYLLKDCAFDELVPAVSTVNGDRTYISSRIRGSTSPIS